MSPVTREPPDSSLPSVLAHIRANAPRYLGATGDVTVQLERSRARERTSVHLIDVRVGASRRRLVVKFAAPLAALEAWERGPSRPRLSLVSDWAERDRFEYLGLVAAERHFGALRDPRLGAVHVLDHLPNERAIVMLHVDDPTLRDRLAGGQWVTPAGRRTLGAAFENAGVWLRHFHGFSPFAPAEALRPTAEAVLRDLREQGDFLQATIGHRRVVGDALGAVRDAIGDGALPEPLPLGLHHGDYAPRNLFVGACGGVAGFDPSARRPAPVYQDIAYFLISLRFGRAGLALRAAGVVRGFSTWERRFLRGYFGSGAVPRHALAVFELLLTLDKWTAMAVATGGGGIARRAYRAAADAGLAREVAALTAVLRDRS